MRLLVLDAALGGCLAAICADGTVLDERRLDGGRGQPAALVDMVAGLLAAAALRVTDLDAVAVTIGPGSFTGLRAALALAAGLAQAAGVALAPVTVAEAMAAAGPPPPARVLWTAIDSRRGRVFLDSGAGMTATDLTALPSPNGPIAVAGDAAVAVASRLAARGADVLLTDARRPRADGIARAAEARLAGRLPPLAALPLYVDPPEAKLPQGGLRPPPVPAG